LSKYVHLRGFWPIMVVDVAEGYKGPSNRFGPYNIDME